MATSSLGRVRVGAMILAAGLVGTAACSGPGGSAGSASPTGQATAAPTSATTTESLYPTTAKAYAEAVLEAWASDLDRLADLTTALVYDQLIQIPGPPNQVWTFRDCEDDATVYCGFFNEVGDWISIRIDKDKFGMAHAASAVEFDPTVYPNDAVDYVKAFVLAWQFGNTARMLQLSTPSVVNALPLNSPPDGENYPTPTCCGGGLVQVEVQWGGGGITFDVGSTLLATPHAIVGHTP